MIINKHTAIALKTVAISMIIIPVFIGVGVDFEFIDKGVNYPSTEYGEIALIASYIFCQILGASIYASITRA